MRRCLRGWVLLAGVCAAWGARAQTANPNPNSQVPNPTGYGGAPAMMVNPQVAAPDFHGMTLQEAQAANGLVPAATNGTKRQIFSALNTTGPADGVVDTQTPLAGTKVYPGQQAATLSMKAVQQTVPVLKGMSIAEARARLAQSSLVLGQVSGVKSLTPLAIATQTPLAGASVARNSAVDVVLEAPAGVQGTDGSTGTIQVPPPIEVTVPSVLKLRANEAAVKLEGARLGRPIVLGPADGVVVFQDPLAGTSAESGSRVRLTMGTQVHEIIIPQQPTGIAWGWWAAGGVVLLGSVLAIVYGVRKPDLPKPGPGAQVVATMVATLRARANPTSAKVTAKGEVTVRWSVLLRDKSAAGVTAVQGEIEGVRRGEG